jgi:hypothetical protein
MFESGDIPVNQHDEDVLSKRLDGILDMKLKGGFGFEPRS